METPHGARYVAGSIYALGLDHWSEKKELLPAGPVSDREKRRDGNSTAMTETRTGV
jgi:hypothetical protein